MTGYVMDWSEDERTDRYFDRIGIPLCERCGKVLTKMNYSGDGVECEECEELELGIVED